MADDETLGRSELLSLTAEIVSAYAANNAIDAVGVPDLISSVFAKLNGLAIDEAPSLEALIPAVPIRRSVTDDFIICLEDGKKLKMLKRHLMTAYGLTPDAYRARWGLKPDYPMVAPNYATKRQELAKKIGLGRKPRAPEPEPEPEPTPAPVKRRARKAAAPTA
jgi:predicted transcriptional regulator